MSILNVNKINPVGGGSTITIAGIASITGNATATTFIGALTGTASGNTTITNNADNRVVTGGSGNALNGESTLTHNGGVLSVNQPSLGTDAKIIVKGNDTDNHDIITAYANSSARGSFAIRNGTGIAPSFLVGTRGGSETLGLMTDGTERLRINSNGAVGINTVVSDQPNVPSLHLHGSAGDDCRISFSTPTKSAPGSRIGYYGLNRFGIDTYDGIEMRDVTRSYATIFKIDNNGYMTTNQPYGHLRFNAENDTGSFVTQSNVHTADVQNGMAHNGSGRLTVPVSGKYLLMLGCNLLDGSQMQFRMMKNGADIPGAYFQNSDGDNAWKSGSRTIVLPLSANDYITSRIVGKQDSQVWNHLTVYLLG